MSKLTCQIEAHNSTSATFYGSTEFGNFQFCTWTYSPSHSRLAESCNHYHGNRDERNRWEIGVFGLKEIGKREIRKRIKIIYWKFFFVVNLVGLDTLVATFVFPVLNFLTLIWNKSYTLCVLMVPRKISYPFRRATS